MPAYTDFNNANGRFYTRGRIIRLASCARLYTRDEQRMFAQVTPSSSRRIMRPLV